MPALLLEVSLMDHHLNHVIMQLAQWYIITFTHKPTQHPRISEPIIINNFTSTSYLRTQDTFNCKSQNQKTITKREGYSAASFLSWLFSQTPRKVPDLNTVGMIGSIEGKPDSLGGHRVEPGFHCELVGKCELFYDTVLSPIRWEGSNNSWV